MCFQCARVLWLRRPVLGLPGSSMDSGFYLVTITRHDHLRCHQSTKEVSFNSPSDYQFHDEEPMQVMHGMNLHPLWTCGVFGLWCTAVLLRHYRTSCICTTCVLWSGIPCVSVWPSSADVAPALAHNHLPCLLLGRASGTECTSCTGVSPAPNRFPSQSSSTWTSTCVHDVSLVLVFGIIWSQTVQ